MTGTTLYKFTCRKKRINSTGLHHCHYSTELLLTGVSVAAKTNRNYTNTQKDGLPSKDLTP